MRILDLAIKDLTQITRDRKSTFFLLVMPLAFTLLFGFMFGGTSSEESDPRMPVGYLDQDKGILSAHLHRLLASSELIRLESMESDDFEKLVADGDLVAAITVPAGFSEKMLADEGVKVNVILNVNTNAGGNTQNEILAVINRLKSVVRTAQISVKAYESSTSFTDTNARQTYFSAALEQALTAWDDPPVSIKSSATGVIEGEGKDISDNAFTQSSPGMMAQFAIAGLISAAGVLVVERKSRALQRLLTTAISRAEILFGHFLAMFVMIFVQFSLLILFGQLFLELEYFSQPLSTLLITISTALFAASMGLLIGTVAKNEDQVVVMTLIPMFVLSGLGGAWFPLELMPEATQFIGHFSPIAWMMDGYKNILIRGQGLEAAILPATVLVGFGLACFGVAVWRFKFE